VDECKPLGLGSFSASSASSGGLVEHDVQLGRGLRSSTFQLIVSAFSGIGGCISGLFRGCLGVFGIRGCLGGV